MEGEITSTATTTTSAAEAVAYTDDVLVEILLFLPAKSIIRFKAVSKHWHSLISTSSFSHLHTLRHRKPQPSFILRAAPSLFFYFNPTRKKFLQFHLNFAHPRILQSCHGLLLLECGSSLSVNRDYYVYNPTTRDSRNLLLEKESLLGLRLAFDPSKSPHYKVICVSSTSYSIHFCEIQVYDSETRTWKRLDKVFTSSDFRKFNDGVYWNSGIYWIASGDQILSFDIENSVLESSPATMITSRGGRSLNMVHLMESSGWMHCVLHKDTLSSLLLVYEYEVKDNVNDWYLKYGVSFDLIAASFGERTYGKISVMGIITGERKEELSLVFHIPGKILVYRFHDGSSEELLDLRLVKFYRERQLQFGYHDAYQFIESLAPV
ncbi:F-box protein [Sesamum alatum]|uniref:F-box protein n=1 Tax=Sesamum alatum TaxID=300844 RepID=A0AAE1YUS9_9LAMI|nr:F-box protein [Sesamum alatum]